MFDIGSVLKNVPNLGTDREQITYLPREQIDSDEKNFYQLSDLEGLADNISVVGLQQPIRVRPTADGRYTIISGHRRRAAVELLAADDPDRWAEVPCIIDQTQMSPALTQLALIYGNANTRTKNDAELAEEAEQVKNLLYQLKEEESFQFPGRMRDHVAEIVGASKSKLARLAAIQKGLSSDWKVTWRLGKLPEASAYVLAAQPSYYQHLAYAFLYTGEKLTVTAETLEYRFDLMTQAAEQLKALPCPEGGICSAKDGRQSEILRGNPYYCHMGTGCCKECPNLEICSMACIPCRALQLQKQEIARVKRRNAKAAEKVERHEREAPLLDMMGRAYNRVKALRKEKSISPQEFLEKSQGRVYPGELGNLEALESGKSKISYRMPGGIWPDEARRLIRTADLLGCSVDYLLGREEPPAPASAENVPNLGTWKDGLPSDPGWYCVIVADGEDDLYTPIMHWNGYRWDCDSVGYIHDTDTILGWSRVPANIPTMGVDAL